MAKAIEQVIRGLAAGRCEYCRTPEAVSLLPFVLDHIIARQHGGQTEQANLALCCAWCNRHKGPNIAGVDPVSRAGVFLFNPRLQVWSDHFQLVGADIVGRTAVGRATIIVLKLNHPTPRGIRLLLIMEGRFDDVGAR